MDDETDSPKKKVVVHHKDASFRRQKLKPEPIQCNCKKIEPPVPVQKRDAQVQTGLELNMQYASDMLLAEIKAPQSWRESLMLRMIEDTSLVGEMTKEQAKKYCKELMQKVETIKARAAGGNFIATAQSNINDQYMDQHKKAQKQSGVSWHFRPIAAKKKKKRKRDNISLHAASNMDDDSMGSVSVFGETDTPVAMKKRQSLGYQDPMVAITRRGPSRRAKSDVPELNLKYGSSNIG